MYTIYADNQLLHCPLYAESGYVVINPVLTEQLNTTGSLEFSIAPNNPFYEALEERKTKIKVVSDTNGSVVWFGRVMEAERGWNNVRKIWCEGEMGCMNDSIFRPYGYTGTISGLLSNLIQNYNDSNTGGYTFALGNVSVTDPNNNIVRSSSLAESVLKVMQTKLPQSSLGGYLMPRYDPSTDTHYIDYLRLDDTDPYAVESTQTVEFGKNLLDFVRHADSTGIITVLIPYGAQYKPDDPNYQADPPTNGTWSGNRLTIEAANNGRDYIENSVGVASWGRIVGSKTWDDVTIASNLKDKATAWLDKQISESITVEISAVDLSYINADIEQIQLGQFVRVISKPHSVNVQMVCTQKQTYLTKLEDSSIVLGVGIKALTDYVQKEAD